MENNEHFGSEQVIEPVEQTHEQPAVKMYTQEEVDAMIGKRLARQHAKITKQYDQKYGQLETVLRAGTGKESVEEMTDTFAQFYQKKGIQIPTRPEYTEEDIAILANADATEIINSGYEEVVEEVDRLTDLGFDNMSARDKIVFKALAEHRQSTERGRELAQIGVTEDVYNSQEFKTFAGMFNPGTPIRDIYSLYEKSQPKKNINTMGSMKNNGTADNGVKDFYSFEEAQKFTKEDFDKNPALYEAVRKSMPKWK